MGLLQRASRGSCVDKVETKVLHAFFLLIVIFELKV
jgi:hypothetical protein